MLTVGETSERAFRQDVVTFKRALSDIKTVLECSTFTAGIILLAAPCLWAGGGTVRKPVEADITSTTCLFIERSKFCFVKTCTSQ